MPSPKTMAVIQVTIGRDMRLSSEESFDELFKVEQQAVDEDSDELAPMLFRYNNTGYTYLETLPQTEPVTEACERIEDYVLNGELLDIELKHRDYDGNKQG